jgi:hypothetical protein
MTTLPDRLVIALALLVIAGASVAGEAVEIKAALLPAAHLAANIRFHGLLT